MAYREPFFLFQHYIRDAGSSLITLEGGEAAGFPKFRLIDNDVGPLFKWSAAAADNAIIFDRGTGTLANIHYIILPAGHNLTGNIRHETNAAGTGGPWNLIDNITVTAGQFEWNVTVDNDRYVRFRVDDAIQGELSELFISTLRKPAIAGPDPAWTVTNEPRIEETQLRSGRINRLETGNPRQELRYTFRRVGASDIAIFDELETNTRHGLYPFWFFPPDTGDVARYVTLGRAIERKQASSNPFGTGQEFDITLSMVEVLP